MNKGIELTERYLAETIKEIGETKDRIIYLEQEIAKTTGYNDRYILLKDSLDYKKDMLNFLIELKFKFECIVLAGKDQQ